MEQNKEIRGRWVYEIWPKVSEIDDIIDVAALNRALPEDIEEAKRLLSEFTEQAAAFLDELSESVRSPTSSERSSTGS